ncbi:MAG TPA: hypothetical protein VD738_04870 [Nitrospira sp.]|nr:hypothetical protein [Nitrospira sp.]
MTNRTSPMRRQSRFPVSWPVLYGGAEFLAEGTVLDLTRIGWRVAGAMPVVPGMPLTLAVWVPDKQDPIRIERATVLWVNGCEFAIEAHEMAPGDHAWVTEFLTRKLGLSWIEKAGDGPVPSQPVSGTSSDAMASPQTSFPILEDLIQWLLGAQPDMQPLDTEVNQWEILEPRGREGEASHAASDRWLCEVWYPALRIIHGMRARRASRALTGTDSIDDN